MTLLLNPRALDMTEGTPDRTPERDEVFPDEPYCLDEPYYVEHRERPASMVEAIRNGRGVSQATLDLIDQICREERKP